MKTILKKTSTAVLTSLLLSSTAMAADVTLRFGHFWPAVSDIHKEIYQAWADEVEADSNGRIKVELYPASMLAKPPAQYDAVKHRILDVTATVQGYSANRFPLTQVLELPGVVQNATQGSCVAQKLYDEGAFGKEYKDSKPLFLFTHGPGVLHVKGKSIEEPSDLEGLRIRRPTAVIGSLLEELGALPIGMPAPQSYQSLQRGVIDGVALPWEGAKGFKLNELADNHTEVGGLYSLAFIVTMNQNVYNKLDDELKAVIDNNSGEKWSSIAATVFDRLDKEGLADAKAANHSIYRVDASSNQETWQPVFEKVTENYLSELDAKGLPGRTVYKRAMELSATCS
ncbi:C4-dicarboxylate ABC transporter substrate-binding protein [Photobacterium sanctipauli]|uniref:C4-dicarboxylate ABC transporter substrate-binding protein n=1 Tax=Photobacterium sanctipauli TaxID=1342794 RepID=A0A2T3P127_9GAMM|nr:TRAP transporter substrate-binding protein [Photobacterium sanctipauli]PSW22225.1 C4-dicarboxylate ABC transporter substrate-binding protein [Photobacterium sanctipauli]